MAEPKSERKSMSDALTLDSQKLAFIHEGEKNVAQQRKVGAASHRRNENDAGQGRGAMEQNDISKESPIDAFTDTGRMRRSKSKFAKADLGDLPIEQSPILVPLTTRITTTTADSLRRASLELRLQRRKYAQQDIVESALRTWLTTHGFHGV